MEKRSKVEAPDKSGFEFISDDEYQREVVMRETPAIIEMLSDLMADLECVEDHSKVKKEEIMKDIIILTEAMVGLGKFLIAISYKMDVLDGAVRSVIRRMDAYEADELEEEKEEETINKDEKDEQHQPYI